MNAEMPSSVRAARATTEARSPLVTHALVPFRTYSSPSRTALQERFLVSLPASGSDRDRAPRLSPVAIDGSRRCFCSSLPWYITSVAHMVWVLMRSEEHTSELQSLMRISYAVFCLKKKK